MRALEAEASRFLPVIEEIVRVETQLAGRDDAKQCLVSLRAGRGLEGALAIAGTLAWLSQSTSDELDALRTRHAHLREAQRQERLRELNAQAMMLPVQAQSSLLAINQRIAAVEALSLAVICRDLDAF